MKYIDGDWQLIEAQLPSGWRELGKKMGLIRERPAHMGTKIEDLGVILRLVFYHAATNASLRATTALAAATGVVSIAAVSLHQWMKKLGPYLTELLALMVDSAAFAPQKWGGFDIIVGDATTVQRPGSKGTTARVHYALRLADMTPRHMEVTDEHGGETARRFRAEPGELWLLDRAYANPAGVAAIHDRGAHIVVRHNRSALPLFDKSRQRIDVMSLLRATGKRGDVQEVPAFVHVNDKEIAGRLCWLRLPESKAEQARRRARKENGPDCDEETLFAAEFVIVFTSVRTELSASQVLDLYRARWQIELEFKRGKSIRDLDRLPNFLPETIHSWICAKLLVQLISARIANATTPQSDSFPPGGREYRLAFFPAKPAKPATNGRVRRSKPRLARAADGRRALVHESRDLVRRVQRVAAAPPR
jgi:Transposase DDE domain